MGKEYVEIQTPFEKAEEARAYLDSHLDELEEKLEKYRNVPYERESENNPRIGAIKRAGDVTPEEFQETFGFRGVEFGECLENKTRQENLNRAYDALTDMAEALKLPPRALSLNGTLGLAFGSRGKGGKNAPLAHYESVKVVINLTKKNGAGSLGHEWFHSLDNYFGRKAEQTTTAMLTQSIGERNFSSISQEVMDGFKLVHKVINGCDLPERCKKLDNRKDKEYWTLPKEMAARAFEVYLKSKLEESGIRNDYPVNYRSEESWAKASENSFKLENTYPYPTAAEMEDIKTAYEYLFDSIRFRTHDKNYELYSSTAENIDETLKDAKILFPQELTVKQQAMQKMSEEVFGIKLRYLESSPELHGRYDEDDEVMYLNVKAATSLEWTFWHEAFHVMKKHEPELYNDILSYVERHEVFSSQQIEDYRNAVNQPKMIETKVQEELLADAFADMNTGRRLVDEISKEQPSIAQRFAAFTQKLINSVKKIFKSKEVREKVSRKYLTGRRRLN